MKERLALIGHTGFVGSFLKSSGAYGYLYNSANIETIRDQHFDVVVCAGTSAVKWRANAEPEKDRQGIHHLMDSLAKVHAAQFFLISTVDVFRVPLQVDENTPIDPAGLHPYGTNRYELENFVRTQFAHSCILRLPTVFGPGLKKNPLYDLLHDNYLDQMPMDGIFQWYNLKRLPDDLRRAEGLPLVHLATEPLAMRHIVDQLFPEKSGIGCVGKAPRYDMRTMYADGFGGKNGYIANAETVLSELGSCVHDERARLQEKS